MGGGGGIAIQCYTASEAVIVKVIFGDPLNSDVKSVMGLFKKN